MIVLITNLESHILKNFVDVNLGRYKLSRIISRRKHERRLFID